MLKAMAGLLSGAARSLYTSANTDAVVTGANTRLSMLPADARSGVASFSIPGGGLPPGGHVLLLGFGTIGARLTTPPGFNFVPWVTPAGGSKTDMAGFAKAPLLGTDGTCGVLMKLTQLSPTLLRTSGDVWYGADAGQPYFISINPGGLGAAGSSPLTTTSDYTQDRSFGVDGFWGTGADAREYVKCRSVTAVLFLPT